MCLAILWVVNFVVQYVISEGIVKLYPFISFPVKPIIAPLI